MKSKKDLSTFLLSLGTSIWGGGVAGFILLKNPNTFAYWALAIFGALLIIISWLINRKK